MKINSYELSNGWFVFRVNSSKCILHVIPIENSLFTKEYCVEIPQELYDAVVDGVSDVKDLRKHHDLYKHATVWTKGVIPSKEKIEERRRKAHANHLDYFYGDYWCIFEDTDHKYFLEYDVGHFASDFQAYQISLDEYKALKNDKSLFNSVRRSIEYTVGHRSVE